MPGFIPWHKVDLWLQSIRAIWLTATRPDGRPHAAPVWFWWGGRDICFTSARNSQKARNIAHQPWVIVHGGDGDDTLIVEGAAGLVTDLAQRQCIDAACRQKYVDPHSGAHATTMNPDENLHPAHVQRGIAWECGVAAPRTDRHFDS